MADETRIWFSSGALRLEALYFSGESAKGVVVSHPHPLYGGDMENGVVHLLVRTFQKAGWSTLRFNFRGVGESQGAYDQGRGETEDVAGAVAHLRERGLTTLVLAGYSFGAWVNARAALSLPEVSASILISPPLELMDFSFLNQDHKTRLIVVGDQDPFAPTDRLRSLVRSLAVEPEIRIIPGADHFYSQGMEELSEAIRWILPRL